MHPLIYQTQTHLYLYIFHPQTKYFKTQTHPLIYPLPSHQISSSQSLMPNHPMITIAKAIIFKPKAFLTTHNSLETSIVTEALSDPKWKDAMQLEYDALTRNKTWSLVLMTLDYKLVGYKWVFRTKYNTDGIVSKHKAILVAK